ncbi:ribosylnicotinamide kinase [Mortierella claussenii]|nr:ribosylnicotinamide kinase [Mortierella claussenii]
MSTDIPTPQGRTVTGNRTRVITIGLSGPSSGGKTTTARYLRSILPNSTLVHQDDFYLPENQLPVDPKTGQVNWDCPEAIDFTALIKTLLFVKENGQFPDGFDSLEDKNPVGSSTPSIPIPDQTLKMFTERIMSQIPAVEDRNHVKFVILDGFILYVNEQLRKSIDIKFFLTAPYKTLKERRESRKGYATLEGYWVDPPGYFDDMVWSNYLAWNEPFVRLTEAMEAGQETGVFDTNNISTRKDSMTQQVDVVSSGDCSIHNMVETVANLLAMRLSELSFS